ncbi:hypothetical protein [Nonomuraea sp. CA-141351]|uniref:hypothetical protein n=1 Tax=Nonomuraea sp. CA-141351 TaxID=3239996 RepID=UPI003D918256
MLLEYQPIFGRPFYLRLDRYRKSQADDVFCHTLKNWACNAYNIFVRSTCRRWAWIYRQGVRLGNPENGANTTH